MTLKFVNVYRGFSEPESKVGPKKFDAALAKSSESDLNLRRCSNVLTGNIRSRQTSFQSLPSSGIYNDGDERACRCVASSISDEDESEDERPLRCSSMSSITLPREFSSFIFRPVQPIKRVSSGRMIKMESALNPHVLKDKKVYIPRRGHGHVISVTKRFGRATEFVIYFENQRKETLRLSRKIGQDGENFFVRDEITSEVEEL